MLMFHNGTVHRNQNFKIICPLKQKEKGSNLVYNRRSSAKFYSGTTTMVMEEYGLSDMNRALMKVGGYTKICFDWEIFKMFFLLHNIKATWTWVPNNPWDAATV